MSIINVYCWVKWYIVSKNLWLLSMFFNNKKSKKKKDGISVCIRINSDFYVEFLERNIQVIYDLVDEILIHYNSLENEEKFLEIVNKFSKIKTKKYPKFLDFVKYTNDFIDEYNYSWLLILDGDIFLLDDEMRECLKSIRKSKKNVIHYYSGVNFFIQNNQILFSNLKSTENFYMRPFVGAGDFLCFCPQYVRCKEIMKYDKNFKMIEKPLAQSYNSSFNYVIPTYKMRAKCYGICFVHLSFLYLENKYNEILDSTIQKNEILTNQKKISISLQTYRTKWFYKKIVSLLNDNTIKKIYDLKDEILSKWNHYYEK